MSYIDPGAGSLVIQVVLGAMAAILIALKLFWVRILVWFKKLSNLSGKDESSG